LCVFFWKYQFSLFISVYALSLKVFQTVFGKAYLPPLAR
jgi:hypothetical protein